LTITFRLPDGTIWKATLVGWFSVIVTGVLDWTPYPIELPSAVTV